MFYHYTASKYHQLILKMPWLKLLFIGSCNGGSDVVVSVICFGVRVLVMFHFMFIILLVQFGLLSGHLLGNSCPLG